MCKLIAQLFLGIIGTGQISRGGMEKESRPKSLLHKFSNIRPVWVHWEESHFQWLGARGKILLFGGIKSGEIPFPCDQVIRSSFSSNRASAKYGFDLSLFDSQFQANWALAGGFEESNQKGWRWKYSASISTRKPTDSDYPSGTGRSKYLLQIFLSNAQITISNQQPGIGPELALGTQPLLELLKPRKFYRGKKMWAILNLTKRAPIANSALGLDLR